MDGAAHNVPEVMSLDHPEIGHLIRTDGELKAARQGPHGAELQCGRSGWMRLGGRRTGARGRVAAHVVPIERSLRNSEPKSYEMHRTCEPETAG